MRFRKKKIKLVPKLQRSPRSELTKNRLIFRVSQGSNLKCNREYLISNEIQTRMETFLKHIKILNASTLNEQHIKKKTQETHLKITAMLKREKNIRFRIFIPYFPSYKMHFFKKKCPKNYVCVFQRPGSSKPGRSSN